MFSFWFKNNQKHYYFLFKMSFKMYYSYDFYFGLIIYLSFYIKFMQKILRAKNIDFGFLHHYCKNVHAQKTSTKNICIFWLFNKKFWNHHGQEILRRNFASKFFASKFFASKNIIKSENEIDKLIKVKIIQNSIKWKFKWIY